MTNPIELLTGYAAKLKAADKDLKSLERKAKSLAEKQVATEEQRIYLEAKITDHRRDAAALHSEHSDLQLRYMKAVYEQDVSVQRDVQARRQEIEAALQEHGRAVEELGTALEQLPSYAEDAAATAAELDALQFGNALRFANELQTVLTSNQRALESRQSEARKKLPAFSQELYREVRSSNDQDYARKLESDRKYQEAQARILKAREERGKLTKAEVRDQESGYLLGYNIKDASGKVVRFEKVQRVPISS
jgi:hypothetical protein